MFYTYSYNLLQFIGKIITSGHKLWLWDRLTKVYFCIKQYYVVTFSIVHL